MDNKSEKIRVCFLEKWAPIDNDKVKKGMYEVSNAGDLLESIGMEDNERNRKFVSRIKRRQSFADISKDYEF